MDIVKVLTRKQAEEKAKELGWTLADAKRAFGSVDFPITTDSFLEALCVYAGPELKVRQRLQAAQKAQVTKKTNYIEQIELAHADTIENYETQLKVERSQFVSVIGAVYKFAQKFGMKDLWVETLLNQYENYYHEADAPNSEEAA